MRRLAGSGSERLRGFHSHYGEDVLAAARAGDAASAGRLLADWIERNPPRPSDAWHPYTISTRAGNWIAALSLAAGAGDARRCARVSGGSWSCSARNVEDDVLGNHVIRNARALVLGGRRIRRDGDARARRQAARARAARPGAAGRRPLRAQPRLPPRRPARPARGRGRDGRPGPRRRDRAHARFRGRPRPARRSTGPFQRRRSRPGAGARASLRRRRALALRGHRLRRSPHATHLARLRLRPAIAAISASARSRRRALVPALAGRAGRSSSTRAPRRTSQAPSATGSAARGPTRRWLSTATSSSYGVRSGRGRCPRWSFEQPLQVTSRRPSWGEAESAIRAASSSAVSGSMCSMYWKALENDWSRAHCLSRRTLSLAAVTRDGALPLREERYVAERFFERIAAPALVGRDVRRTARRGWMDYSDRLSPAAILARWLRRSRSGSCASSRV